MKRRFEIENTWEHYNEIALTPSLMLVFDNEEKFGGKYYSLTLHFLAWKVGFDWK